MACQQAQQALHLVQFELVAHQQHLRGRAVVMLTVTENDRSFTKVVHMRGQTICCRKRHPVTGERYEAHLPDVRLLIQLDTAARLWQLRVAGLDRLPRCSIRTLDGSGAARHY